MMDMLTGQRLPLCLCAMIFGAASAAPACAETATVADHVIRFLAPSGYCLVNPVGAVGEVVFEQVKKIWAEDFLPIGVYIDCGELSTLLTDHRSPPLHIGSLFVVKRDGEIDVRSEGTRRDELDRVAERLGRLDLAAINEEIKKHNQELDFKIPELAAVQMVDRDSSAAYVASLSKPNTQGIAFVKVTGLTLVNHLPLSVTMAAPLTDRDVLNALLRAQHRYLASLIDLNETPDQEAPTGPTHAQRLRHAS